MRRGCRLIASAALCLASPALAQSGPRFSGSLQLGWEYTAGGEFVSRSGYAGEGTGTARVAVVHGIGVMLSVADERIGVSGDVVSLCNPEPRPCQGNVANLSGWSGRVGFERQFEGYLAVSGSIGVGWYDNDERSGGAHVIPMSVSLIMPALPHVSLVGTVERLQFRQSGAGVFHANAVLLGLRVE